MTTQRVVERRTRTKTEEDTGTDEPQWHAVYTRPRAEKKVQRRLQQRSIRTYLPLKTEERKWSDRIKTVQVPLFRSYVFVKVGEAGALKTLRTPGVARIVTFRGKRAVIPEEQIEAVRRILQERNDAKVVSHLVEGEEVRVKNGPLKGLEGTCMEDGDRQQIQVRIDAIDRVMRVVISPHDLESIEE
jgi:transcription antitermination factor NusG